MDRKLTMTDLDTHSKRDETPSAEGRDSVGQRRPWWRKLAFLVPLIALAFVVDRVTLPYYVLGPGPARDVEPLIQIEGTRTYPTDGRFLLTAVRFSRPNIYRLIAAWLDPARAVVPEDEIVPPGQTPEEEFEVALSQMDTSKIDAAVVALTAYGGYPEDRRPGILVESVVPESPAEGKLFPGDLITRIDGLALDDLDDLRARIAEAGTDRSLRFTVEAGGETRQVNVRPAQVPGIDGPAVGIAPVHNFPFPLTIESGDIGGPSAGLMWTLGVIELLTPEDLSRGRVIAGTGAITLEGEVEAIGGVEEKVVAAEDAGASIFFVPVENAAAARSVARDIAIVPVDTFRDAVRYLERTA
ncbi:MAG: PDZ domain-containing protein [Actinobacteria bacterium]|nr:PDZ domain-containing protein [Actinomycetota bacterium]